MPVVALIPLILFPLLGICKLDEAAAPYANSVVYLFMGGFIIGLAIEKWMLHKRIALSILRVTGTSGNRIILGFILSTGFISMWLSNTATTMMMYPIALSVVHVMEENHSGEGNLQNMVICLLLSIAYASNFGGIATIIGTPPNVALVGFLEKKYGYIFPFVNWMLLCMPLSILLLMSLYWVMTKWLFKNNIKKDAPTELLIKTELTKMGNISIPEKRVLWIFLLTAVLWITRDLVNHFQKFIKLDDTLIALLGAILLFIVPSGEKSEPNKPLLIWKDTNRMAWGILLLFGGGLTLANQLEKAGLVQQLGDFIGNYATGDLLILISVVTLLSIFVSEVMSNVAQVIVFAPVMAGLSDAIHLDPLYLTLPMALGASCASMLPMGTPPNAIVFASGRLPLSAMLKTGFAMNVIATILISLFAYYLIPILIR
jgi:sodium-dependent dicarboxylate transporter 2/3/5